MSIDLELQVEILRLYHAEKWRITTISTQLHVHHSTVRRVLSQEGKVQLPCSRVRQVDAFIPFIEGILKKYPNLTASRLLSMVKERGYKGQASNFRGIISQMRPFSRKREAYFRLRTLPGEQAQVDWGHFGRIEIGKASRPLMAFVMVLSYSRAIYLRFFLSQSLSNFMHGHQLAFGSFGGVPRECLYDNLRSVVLERSGKAIRFNPQFMEFAGYHRFLPKPVAVRRGNEKGRVERAIRYIRSSFFAARRFATVEELNEQALEWCNSTALERLWPQERKKSVREIFIEEQPTLIALPADEYPCDERSDVSIGKCPYARFDLNDYSVPAGFAQRTVTVQASLEVIRILDGNTVIATHRRSYDQGREFADPGHTKELAERKAAAGQHQRTNFLVEAAPSTATLLTQAVKRGFLLGRTTKQLEVLLRTYGASALEAAVCEVLEKDLTDPHAVRQVLERYRHESGKRPSLPLSLPNDTRVSELTLKPQSLSAYAELGAEEKTKKD